MPIKQDGSKVVVTGKISGSVFPTNEKDTVFPVLIEGESEPVNIEGALYGRSLEMRGAVNVQGPVVARGDLRISPRGKLIQMLAGLTVNGSVNCEPKVQNPSDRIDVNDAQLIIKGDIAANQNISLKNAVVFGSIRAVNCTLENTIVLGTCIIEESLVIKMSSIGGYASRDVTFEGSCVMIHALGESLSQPIMVPYEISPDRLISSDIRYYPVIRGYNQLLNNSHLNQVYPEYSILSIDTDWINSRVSPNAALDELSMEAMNKWVLSIGGRIGDTSLLSDSIDALTSMLKCGFEFEHYHPQKRNLYVKNISEKLTEQESWILNKVCQ